MSLNINILKHKYLVWCGLFHVSWEGQMRIFFIWNIHPNKDSLKDLDFARGSIMLFAGVINCINRG